MITTIDRSPLPSRHSVRNTLQDLIGRDVEMSDGLPPVPKSTNVVGVFVTEKLATSAVVLADLECAARLGGCLGLVTRMVVDEAIAARELPPTLFDNCYEVLNVLAGVFNPPRAPHVRFYQLYGPNTALPADIAQFCASVGARMDVALKISGYGPGQLSIVVR